MDSYVRQALRLMITRVGILFLIVGIIFIGCRRDLPLSPNTGHDLIDRICWEPEQIDTVYSAAMHSSNSVQFQLPAGMGPPSYPSFYMVAFNTGGHLVVQFRTYLPGVDTLGIRITSPYGSCDQPLHIGDSISPFDPVYSLTTLYDDAPSVSCLATPSVRHIGFVRLVLGRKYAGHIRIRCIATPDGLRRYWTDKVCLATEPGRTIDIQ